MPRVRPPISPAAVLGAGLVPAGHDDLAALVGVGLRELAAESLRAADDDDAACAHVGLLSRQRRRLRLGVTEPAMTS